ncbi:D-serine deaminase, pyridoxal phosphate-dependent [Sanguibacter gelidistatuariae]|uniref:D-serine deaminase, pyridoxal phosphate-dependent n=1 Tax=Sanguibacter gelidistatuariae TaxID=1814289 RepID=A0A1G6PPJ3_9MICO|nr:alanine racemase [Sanguibacter gelidistatuariae]SDC82083.1 D-serine deaminase, pyridoxal phosphate-dependent [Sanguibacter gelidistatuariae]
MTLGQRLDAATRGLPAPLAVVDLDAFEANADALVRRAAGVPIRVASKSLRVRSLLTNALGRPGFRGVMAYSLAEALWLVGNGIDDVLVAYPSVDRGALAELAISPRALAQITIMVDDVAHLDLITDVRARALRDSAAAADTAALPVRLCLDVDASLRLEVHVAAAVATVHLGVRRSPVHTPQEAGRFAARAAATDGVRLVGAMFYEGQVAGMPDTSAAVRLVKKLSVRDLASRRGTVVAAIEAHVGPLEIVNSGGTGSLETSSADSVVTEVAAGSGLYKPGLFDGYRTLDAIPSAFFGLDVVRHPTPHHATAFGGGYIASGPPSLSRQPLVVSPPGLGLLPREGAGEVQTPLRARRRPFLDGRLGGLFGGRLGGRGSATVAVLPAIGDRVWLRHAKAGEQYERFDEVHLVRGEHLVETVPTYRGEGKNFG